VSSSGLDLCTRPARGGARVLCRITHHWELALCVCIAWELHRVEDGVAMTTKGSTTGARRRHLKWPGLPVMGVQAGPVAPRWPDAS